MFSSLGSKVTLVVSRQQVLPAKDPEVAAVLEDDFLERGVTLLKGARAIAIDRTDDEVDRARATTAGWCKATHAVLAIGSVPNTDGLGLEAAGVERRRRRLRHRSTTTARATCRHIYAAGDVSGKLPLSSVAAMQGRKVAEHVMGLHTVEHRHLDYDKAASAIFTEPEIADVGLAEAEAFAVGPQDPRHQGAVLRRRRRRSSTTTPAGSSRSSPTRRPAWCSAARSSAATPPS